ncbi:transcription initiation at TATA-containing promoter protein [Rhizina undulata]
MAVMSPQPPASVYPHDQKPVSAAPTPASVRVGDLASEETMAMDLDLHGTNKQEESTSAPLSEFAPSPKEDFNANDLRSSFVNGNSSNKGVTAPPSPPIPTPPLHNSTDGTQDLSDLHITSPVGTAGFSGIGAQPESPAVDGDTEMKRDNLSNGGVDGADSGDGKQGSANKSSSEVKPEASSSNNVASTVSTSAEKAASEGPSGSKSSRDREDDDGDRRPVKRAKTDESAESKSASTSTAVSTNAPLTAPQAKFVLGIVRSLRRTKDARPFSMPVDSIKLNVPHYYQIITHPMDLQTMEKKLNNNEYTTLQSFLDDFNLILANTLTFNGPEHPVTLMSKSMEAAFERQMKQLPSADAVEPEKPKNNKKKGGGKVAAAAAAQVKAPATKAPKTTQVKKEPKAKAHSPAAVAPSPTFGLKPSGVPQIRRETHVDGRPKREIHPPAPKDLPYSDVKPRRKKNATELKFCDLVLRELLRKQHEAYAFPFYAPVDPVALNIPDYFKIIREPMDLQTIGSKLKSNQYESASEFEADIRLMFSNCYKFNPSNQAVHQMGRRLEGVFDLKWAERTAYLQQHQGSHSPVAASPQPEEEEEMSEEDEDDKKNIAMLEQQLEMMKNQISAIKKQKKKTPPAPQTAKVTKNKNGGNSRKNSIAAPPPPPPPKKAVKKKKEKEVPYITLEQKTELSERINHLPPARMVHALKMIKENMPDLGNTAEDEIELDIDELDPNTLYKLHAYVSKHTTAPKKVYQPPPPPASPPPVETKPKTKNVSKAKKNKPMTASEQEAKIKDLQARLQNFDNPTPQPVAATTANHDDSDSSDDDDSSASESEEE